MNTTIAYLAGIVDGEGSVGYYSAGKDKRKRLTIKVGMTEESVVSLLHTTFGGSFYKRKPTQHKDVWVWQVTDNLARQALVQLQPYLRIKGNPH